MALAQYLTFAGRETSYGELPLDVLAGEKVFTLEATFSTTDTRDYNINHTFGTITGRDISGSWKDDWSLCVNAGKLCFWAEATNGGSASTRLTKSTAIVSDGKIHHVAVTANYDGSVDLYCDGENVGHKDYVYPRITNQATILLGQNSNKLSALSMNLHELRFWTTSRTAEEIFSQSQLTGEFSLSTITGEEEDLRAWYIPTNANTLLDKSPNHFDATLYDVTYGEVNDLQVSFSVDIFRRIKNVALTWKYFNAGLAALLSIAGTTLPDLPPDKSKTGTAFYQTTRQKCFDVPTASELWVKFDVYYDGINRWRAYDDGDNASEGLTVQTTNKRLTLFSNHEIVDYLDDIAATNRLQTILLHLKSGTVGLIEAWLRTNYFTDADVAYIFADDDIDTVPTEIFANDYAEPLPQEDIDVIFGDRIFKIGGEKIFSYIGDVNHGQPFSDFYLQSDGAGTFFSNVIISNAEIDFAEDMEKISATFDVERKVTRSIQFTADVERTVTGVSVATTFSADVEIKAVVSTTFSADVQREIKVTCQFVVDIVFSEMLCNVEFTVDVWRSLVFKLKLYPLNFNDYWQVQPVLRSKKKFLLASEDEQTPILTPPKSVPPAENTGEVQSLEITIAEQQITDVVKFTGIGAYPILADIRAQYLDYICLMRVESVQHQGILYSCVCCSNIDELLYSPLNYSLPSIQYSVWYMNKQNIPRQICPLASDHINKIASALGLKTVMQFKDFYSTIEFGTSIENGSSYNDIMRELFGWSARVPTDLINVYIRADTLYVIQRGFESRVIDISNADHTKPVVSHELVRLFFSRNKWSETEVQERKTARKATGYIQSDEDWMDAVDDMNGKTSTGQKKWLNVSSVVTNSLEGTITTTYFYSADGTLLKTVTDYKADDETNNYKMTTVNQYNDDGTLYSVFNECRHHDDHKDEDTQTETVYGYITLADGKKFLANEIIRKYVRSENGWELEDERVTTKNVTGGGQDATADNNGKVHAGGNRGDDRPSPYYDDNPFEEEAQQNIDDFDTVKEYRDIDGLTLFDTSFPIQNITHEFFANNPFPVLGLTDEQKNSVDTAKGRGRLIELTDKIKWLNRKTKETLNLSVYDVPHLIDFNDRIRLDGKDYYLVNNTARSEPHLRNEQKLTLVRWF